jgi:hypothetical protein
MSEALQEQIAQCGKAAKTIGKLFKCQQTFVQLLEILNAYENVQRFF